VCGPRAGLSRSSGHATHAKLPRVAGQRVVAHKKAASHKKHAVKHHAKAHHKSRHKTYRVKSGDTLAKIARHLHVAGGWKALFRANRSHLSNPNVLRVGQVLRLP
jgi:nucleoid-associated protein YgaU